MDHETAQELITYITGIAKAYPNVEVTNKPRPEDIELYIDVHFDDNTRASVGVFIYANINKINISFSWPKGRGDLDNIMAIEEAMNRARTIASFAGSAINQEIVKARQTAE